MSCKTRIFAALLVFAVLFSPSGRAQEENRLIAIPPGVSQVDLTADGYPEMIINAWAGRFQTAYHGYHDVTFLMPSHDAQFKEIPRIEDYPWPKNKPDQDYPFDGAGENPSIIGVEPASGGHLLDHIHIDSHDGCLRTDYRIFFKNHKAHLVAAFRDTPGRCDASPVKFVLYEMARPDELSMALSDFYFKIKRQWTTDKYFQDVTDAFQENNAAILSNDF